MFASLADKSAAANFWDYESKAWLDLFFRAPCPHTSPKPKPSPEAPGSEERGLGIEGAAIIKQLNPKRAANPEEAEHPCSNHPQRRNVACEMQLRGPNGGNQSNTSLQPNSAKAHRTPPEREPPAPPVQQHQSLTTNPSRPMAWPSTPPTEHPGQRSGTASRQA